MSPRPYTVHHTNDDTVKYIVEIDGVCVEVSEEIYIVYSQMGRHAKYLEYEKDAGRILSLEKMGEDELQPGYVGLKTVPDVQDTFLKQEDGIHKSEFGILTEAVNSLNTQSQELIYALFVQKLQGKEYAKRTGVSEAAVSKRKKRALKKIENFLGQKG